MVACGTGSGTISVINSVKNQDQLDLKHLHTLNAKPGNPNNDQAFERWGV